MTYGVVVVVPRGVAVAVVALRGVAVTFVAPCGVGPWCGVAVTVVALRGAAVGSQSSRSLLSLHIIAIVPLSSRLVVRPWWALEGKDCCASVSKEHGEGVW